MTETKKTDESENQDATPDIGIAGIKYDFLANLDKFIGVDIEIENRAVAIARRVHYLLTNNQTAEPSDFKSVQKFIQALPVPTSSHELEDLKSVLARATEDLKEAAPQKVNQSNEQLEKEDIKTEHKADEHKNSPSALTNFLSGTKKMLVGSKTAGSTFVGAVPYILSKSKSILVGTGTILKRGWKGAVIGTVFLPGIGTVAGWFIDSFFISKE